MIQKGKFAKKFSRLSAAQLTLSKDLSENGDCRDGIVASARRLFESLSLPVSPVPCRQSMTVTRRSSWQTSGSDTTSSVDSGISTVTGSRESLSSSTGVCSSSSPGEFNDDAVTPIDLPDTARSHADTDTSRDLSVTAPASDNFPSRAVVLREEVSLLPRSAEAVKSDVTTGAVDVNRLRSGQQDTTQYSTRDACPERTMDANSALTSDEDKEEPLDKDQEISLNCMNEETVTMHFDDLSSLNEETIPVSDIRLDIYKTSAAKHDVYHTSREVEDCTNPTTDGIKLYLVVNDHKEVEIGNGFEAEKSMRVDYLDGKNQSDVSFLSEDCCTSKRAVNRQPRTAVRGRRRTAPVKSNPPAYCTVIHLGSEPDDVVIETSDDQAPALSASLRPTPDNGRCLTESEPLDQSAAVLPWRLACRSQSHPERLSVVVRGSTDYVVTVCSEDDSDVRYDNSVNPITSRSPLISPATRRPQVFHLRPLHYITLHYIMYSKLLDE